MNDEIYSMEFACCGHVLLIEVGVACVLSAQQVGYPSSYMTGTRVIFLEI